MVTADLMQKLLDFRDARNWRQFHTAKNLSAALVVEAGELLEIFQWVKDDQVRDTAISRQVEIEQEVADVVILVTYLAYDLGINIEDAVARKLIINGEKYPVHLSRGTATKYDRL